MTTDDDTRRKLRKTKTRKMGSLMHQTFSSYITFSYQTTACLGCFLTLYAILMGCILPMLQTEPAIVPQGPLEGAHLPLPEKQKEQLAHAASNLRAQFRKLRKGSGVTDESLLNEAIADFKVLRAKKHNIGPVIKMERKPATVDIETPGVVVLGMHRSGTSMLSGLLVQGIGYNVGGPLIGAAFDNEKGFFERIDVVLQNDEFMQAQKIWWADGVRGYDADKAYEDYKSGKVSFQQGAKGLEFLNDPNNAPWLQKDPRMCITLKTWLKLLDKKPAIVFTYRHPLEVALSLVKREKNFKLEYGLRLWIVYNMRAIQNSEGLCRVLSSNDKILEDPLREVQRIADELTSKCHMPAGPSRITEDEVNKFIDPNLQHNKKQLKNEQEQNVRILEDHDGCQIKDYTSEYTIGSPQYSKEYSLYTIAMKIFCDFQSGKAYDANYEWPQLPA